MNTNMDNHTLADDWQSFMETKQHLKRWTFKVFALIILILVIVRVGCAQIYYGAGLYGPKIGGQAIVGVQLKQWSVQGEIQRGILQPPAYFNLNAGYTYKWLRVYTGPVYRVTGNHSTQDRHILNGQEIVLSKGYNTNCLSLGGGLNGVFGPVTVDVGWKQGLQVGVLFVWRKNQED